MDKPVVKRRVAIATGGKAGLDDEVSGYFGRAKTFTIIDFEDKKIINIEVLDNPALSYAHGAGPIAIKTLIDKHVQIVIANELGIGASEILQQHKVIYKKVQPGTVVEEAVKKILYA